MRRLTVLLLAACLAACHGRRAEPGAQTPTGNAVSGQPSGSRGTPSGAAQT